MQNYSANHWQPLADILAAHECQWSRDPQVSDGLGGNSGDIPSNTEWGIHALDDPPHNRLLGPEFARGPATAVIVKNGVEIAGLGQPDRADMTFSVTKTYLALVAGIAFDDGLMPDPDEAIFRRVPGIGFDDDHNCNVTWAHMLQFTSEWSGTCFGIPDQIDHYRVAGFQTRSNTPGRKGDKRTLSTPGCLWEYNDVRINQFALALAHLFKCSLPDVFNERIASRIGTSGTHHWYGYNNSWVTIDGRSVQSVPGGGHWGGGMRISARDQSIIGRLMLNRGLWNKQRILSSDWIDKMLTPCDIAPFYGYFTWLNTGQKNVAEASAVSYFGLGVGGQVVWHEPEQDLVAVFRWIDMAHLNSILNCVKTLVK